MRWDTRMGVEHPDPKTVAQRERRRKAKRKREQKAFELRSSREFSEFQDIFESISDRARLAGAKRHARLRECKPWVSRNHDDMVRESLRSRLVTAIYKRRKDWHLADVGKWLEMLGTEGIEISTILEGVKKRAEREWQDWRGA